MVVIIMMKFGQDVHNYVWDITIIVDLTYNASPPKQANEEANVQNDIPAARDSYRGYKVSVWGLSFWFGITLGLTITLGVLGGTGVL